MSKRSVVTFVFMLIAGAAAPLYAQEPAGGRRLAHRGGEVVDHHRRIRAGVRGRPGALAQGRAVSAAAEGIARNPDGRRRHPRFAAPRSGPDRVAGDLRAADFADPVLPEAVHAGGRERLGARVQRFEPEVAQGSTVALEPRPLNPCPTLPPRVTSLDALLLLMTIIWGTNFTVIKSAFRELDPQAFNGVRMIVASLAFLAVMGAARLVLRTRRPTRHVLLARQGDRRRVAAAVPARPGRPRALSVLLHRRPGADQRRQQLVDAGDHAGADRGASARCSATSGSAGATGSARRCRRPASTWSSAGASRSAARGCSATC